MPRALESQIQPVEALVLRLTQPHMTENGGSAVAIAMAELVYYPGDGGLIVRSQPFRFIAPIGEIEQQEIRWYIESYSRWPTGVFKTRAGRNARFI